MPDLSDIDVALRPLLTAMLAPNPDDRPANMAEVAAWGETGERTTVAPAPVAASPKAGGRLALVAAAGAVVVIALGAAAYLLREPLSGVAPTPGADAVRRAAEAAAVADADQSSAASPVPTPSQMESPTVDSLKDQLPPVAPPDVALDAVTVGAAVNSELPPFEDPGGKGLALHAAPTAPPGLTLHDLGNGRSTLEGTAATAGRYAFEVVAINHNERSARMKVTLEVRGRRSLRQPCAGACATPAPAQASVDLEPATVGAPYSAPLPPFRSKDKLALRADRAAGGAGLRRSRRRLEPARRRAGQGRALRLRRDRPDARRRRGPHERSHRGRPCIDSPTDADAGDARAQMAAFLAARDGPCFFARAADDDALAGRFIGMGDDRGAFDSFSADYKKAFQREPELRAELVTPGQCPLVELMKLPAASAAPPPRLTLDSATVGAGRPLSGAVTELAQRALILLAVGDDGRAVKVRAQIGAEGKSASFSLGMKGDADSLGKPQLLIALASDRPFAELETFRAGASADLMRKIAAHWREAGAAATLALFRLTN